MSGTGEWHRFVRPGQVSSDRPTPDACMECGQPEAEHQLREALAAVLEALDIPSPATVGDGETHDRILRERVMHAVIFLRSVVGERRTPPEWSVDYLREQLAKCPAEGYRTWDQAVAEMRAREAGNKQAGDGI